MLFQPGMEKAAAFLESRRYLAYLNGTVEFNKWEGLSYDPDTKTIYTALSVISYGMEDMQSKGKNATTYDIGTLARVRVLNACNLHCWPH